MQNRTRSLFFYIFWSSGVFRFDVFGHTSSDCGVCRNHCMVVILSSSLMLAVDLTVGLVASSSSL